VSGSRKLLLVSGLLLTMWGMSYGLYYALFDEHQTLERMGERLASSFARAAQNQMDDAHAALDDYAAARFEYIREVDVHSHWSGLALLLILFGLTFDQLGFSERTRGYLAALLVLGSFAFPLGVILQTLNRGRFPQVLAVVGSALLILALTGVAVGLACSNKDRDRGKTRG